MRRCDPSGPEAGRSVFDDGGRAQGARLRHRENGAWRRRRRPHAGRNPGRMFAARSDMRRRNNCAASRSITGPTSSRGRRAQPIRRRARRHSRAAARSTRSARFLDDEPRPLPPGVLAPLAYAITTCLAKNPAHRFQSARALLDALDSTTPRPWRRRPDRPGGPLDCAVLPFADPSPTEIRNISATGWPTS